MHDYDIKNTELISITGLNKVKDTRVLIVGLGGIGGHLANHLARLGVKTLHLCDHDVFQPSNINRQLFSSVASLGSSKADIVGKAVQGIRQDVKVVVHACRIENLDSHIWNDIDIVMDALDNVKTRIYLEDMAYRHNVPLIHGAIGGWYGQVGIIMPGSRILARLYQGKEQGPEAILGSPTFTPSVIAGIMVGEFVKCMQNDEHALIDKIMMIDLLNHDYQILTFDEPNERKERL